MYSKTITLFNRRRGSDGDTWYPTILHNVNLNIDKAAIVAKYGDESQNRAILNVRYTTDNGLKFVEGKEYKTPKQWAVQDEAVVSGMLTFTDGNKFDFFIVTDWGNEYPIADDDYTDGFFDYVSNRYDYVFAVASVAEYDTIPHFEVMGK